MLTVHEDNGGRLHDFLESVPHSWSQATHQDRIFIFDAFISHASVDVEQSRLLSDKLRARGLRIWCDYEQRMDDARWRLRLVNALRNSRFVIAVAAPGSDLLARKWVQIECNSALDSEALLPSVSRLVVGRTTPDAPVPAKLADCKQFVLQAQFDELVAFVQAGNRLPPLGCAPPTMSLGEAQTLVRSTPQPNPSEELWDEPKPSKQLVMHALMTSVGDSLVETEAAPTRPSYGLYRVWGISQIDLDEPVRNDDVEWLIPVLEALTAVGHTESRANACFGLHGIATWGASAAAAALCRVVVREENEDIVGLVAGWFGRTVGLDWSSLSAEECARVLLMLPLTRVELRRELFVKLPLALSIVALPGVVSRVTHRAFEQLQSVASTNEALARFEVLHENGSAIDWEIYFRDLEAFVGVDSPLAHPDHVLLPERVDTYLLLVNEFARIELERGSNMTWRMMYEPAILAPLAKLSVHDLYRDRAMISFNAVLDAMESPVQRDLDARRLEPIRTMRELGHATRLFLIEAFRRGPYFEQMEQGTYVRLVSHEDSVELMRRSEHVSRLKAPTQLQGTNDYTHSIDDVWAGID